MTKIIFLLFFNSMLFSQNIIIGDIEDYVNEIIINMPNGNSTDEYISPTESDLAIFKYSVENILVQKYDSANTIAVQINYEVINFIDTTEVTKEYYILQRRSNGNYWGTYIFNPEAKREYLIFQTPHPKYDYKTGQQSFYIFKNLDAYIFCLSGTHKCNSSQYSSCTGTTTVCSGFSENFRMSDQAHTTTSMFQAMTEVLESSSNDYIYIQLHGFAKGVDDPNIIMSNGTRYVPTIDYLTRIKNELEAIDPSLTFKIAHIDTDWTRLIATTNVQGELINGSDEPCNTYPTNSSGRFLHFEQSYEKLRDSVSNWDKILSAFENVFPENLNLKLKIFLQGAYRTSSILNPRYQGNIRNYNSISDEHLITKNSN